MEINSRNQKPVAFSPKREFSASIANCEPGLNHLCQLLFEAHREYQEYVIAGRMTQRVFAR